MARRRKKAQVSGLQRAISKKSNIHHKLNLLRRPYEPLMPTISLMRSNDPRRFKRITQERYYQLKKSKKLKNAAPEHRRRVLNSAWNDHRASRLVYDGYFHRMVCFRRKMRRSTLFRLRHIGHGRGGPINRKWNFTSGIKC